MSKAVVCDYCGMTGSYGNPEGPWVRLSVGDRSRKASRHHSTPNIDNGDFCSGECAALWLDALLREHEKLRDEDTS